jgi:hypothetical protein
VGCLRFVSCIQAIDRRSRERLLWEPSRLNDVQRQAIVQMIESGPIPAIHGVVRWRLIDPSQWIYEEFRITVANRR